MAGSNPQQSGQPPKGPQQQNPNPQSPPDQKADDGNRATTPRPDAVQKSPDDPDRKNDPADFTTIEKDVDRHEDAKGSVVILLDQIADRFAAVADDPNKVRGLAAKLRQHDSRDRLAAAVVNNTNKDVPKDKDGNPTGPQPVKPIFTGAAGGTGAGGGSAGVGAGATGANIPPGTVICDAGVLGTSESAKPRGPK